MWICHCNVGKTNRLKQNGNENIWCHQNMNRKKCVYVDNDPDSNTEEQILFCKILKIHFDYTKTVSEIDIIKMLEWLTTYLLCLVFFQDIPLGTNRFSSSRRLVLLLVFVWDRLHSWASPIKNEKKSARSFNFIFAI